MDPILFQDNCKLLPIYFQKLLSRLKLIKDTAEDDILFIAVLYNILESGFIPSNEQFNDFETFSYNLKALKMLSDLPFELIYNKKKGKFIIFEAKTRFGAKGNPEVTIIGQPSYNSLSKYLVVNMFIQHPSILTSYCFKVSDWVEIKSDQYNVKDREKLSTLTKNNLAVPIKNALYNYFNLNHAPMLNRLPIHIIEQISSYLNAYDKGRLRIVITNGVIIN